MDNEDVVARDGTAVRALGSEYAEPSGAGLGGASDTDRNPVFNQLVKSDGDIVGLVAYSIYKQNKLDWLLAFQRSTGREPNEHENAAYIIGEATPRRLATYRHLAESTLAGSGPDVPSGGGKTGDRSLYANRGKYTSAQGRTTTIVIYAILAIVLLVAIIAAVKFLPRT